MADETVSIAIRVPAELAEAFRRVAEAQERTVSGELRRLMRQRVAEVLGGISQPDTGT